MYRFTYSNYVVSLHGAEELDDDNLSILDLENILLTSQIVARQRDRQTREVKCVVRGFILDGRPADASSSSARLETSLSSPSTSPDVICASCGRPGVLLRRVSRSFGRGRSLLVIEGVPMCSCPHCAASYFTAQTMHEIERIKALRKSVAVDRQVPVAMFRELCA
ncbi:MAG: YgiT-type zinc finger protein [Casimicrobiaceae bacterium]